MKGWSCTSGCDVAFGKCTPELAREQLILNPCWQHSSVSSLHEVRDNSDRMFVQEEYITIQHVTGEQCTCDACCENSGKKTHCAAYGRPVNLLLQLG